MIQINKDIYFNKRIPRADQVRDWYYDKDETRTSYEKFFRIFQDKFLEAQRKAILSGSREVFLVLETVGSADGVESDFEEYLDRLGYKLKRIYAQEIWNMEQTRILGYRYQLAVEW